MTGVTAAGVSGAIVLLAVAWFTIVHSVSLVSVLAVYVRLRSRRSQAVTSASYPVVAPATAPAISIVFAARGEPATIVEQVRALLLLDYPRFEVVVVSEGEAGGTPALAADAFGLVRVPLGPGAAFPAAVAGVYRSLAYPDLVVLDVNGAGRTSAINAGVGAARHPLVCLVDAGSIVEAQALTHAVLPFLRWPETVATTGGVRIANGGTVDEGRGVRLRLPPSRLAALQVVERLRAHVPGQVNLSAMNGLLAIPAAFGLFRRDALVEAGGIGSEADGGDMELTLRLHRIARGWRRPYRIVYRTDPVCWIVAPERWRPLAAGLQRRQRAIVRALARHRSMILNPRFGALGLLILPSSLAFEALGPLVETSGYVAAAAAVAAGVLDPAFAELLFLSAIVYGTLVSVAAVLLEELSSGRDARASDVLRLALYGVLENIGYRQATAWWRLCGVFAAFGRRRHGIR